MAGKRADQAEGYAVQVTGTLNLPGRDEVFDFIEFAQDQRATMDATSLGKKMRRAGARRTQIS